jgi:malate dehydrogenase
MSKKPVRVAVTGAAGQIGYAILSALHLANSWARSTPDLVVAEAPMEKPQQVFAGVMMEGGGLRFPIAG